VGKEEQSETLSGRLKGLEGRNLMVGLLPGLNLTTETELW
jgi:hypothetical protein